MHVLLGPAHLGDVHQAFDARLQLHEGAVVGDVGDAALELGADRILDLDALPGIGLELLHAQGDALRLRIEPDHLHLHRLADMQGLGRMIDAPPGDVRDVQQTVDAAEIDEGAVVGQVLHHALQHLAFLQAGHELGAGFRAALLEHGAARHHDVAAGAIHLEDLERLRRAHQRADVAHRADVDLAAGQEGHGAGEVDGEAALDAAEDHAGDALVLLEVLLELRPGFFAARLLAAEHGFAMLVFHALEIDLDQVADLDLGLLAGRSEFLEGDAPFGLQAHIDQHGVGLDRDDGALDHGAFEAARCRRRIPPAARRNSPCGCCAAVAALAI